MMGLPKPPSVESNSLVPVLAGRTKKARDLAIASPTVYNEKGRVTGMPKGERIDPSARSSITDGEWMLICGARPDKSAGAVYTAAVDSRIREVTNIQGEISPQLYHLTEDPGCLKDLIQDKAAVARSLQQAYVDFLRGKGIPEKYLQLFRSL
jgi:hypothetical protein